MKDDYPAMIATISDKHPWQPVSRRILRALCPTLALLDNTSRRNLSLPIQTNDPSATAANIAEYVRDVCLKRRGMGPIANVCFHLVRQETQCATGNHCGQIEGCERDNIYDANPSLQPRVRLSLRLSERGKAEVELLSLSFDTISNLGGDLASVFKYAIVPAMQHVKPNLLVGSIILEAPATNPVISHCLQWLTAQLEFMSVSLSTRRSATVTLFSGQCPAYLRLDATALYTETPDGLTVAFPECEKWTKRGASWQRSPTCSPLTMRHIQSCYQSEAFKTIMVPADLLEAVEEDGGVASFGELYRGAVSPAALSSDTCRQRAERELSGGFSPLAGHVMSWIYSPRRPGTAWIVKKTSAAEGAFYTYINRLIHNFDVRLSAESPRASSLGSPSDRKRVNETCDKAVPLAKRAKVVKSLEQRVMKAVSPTDWLSVPGNASALGRHLELLQSYLPEVSAVHEDNTACYVEMGNLLHTDLTQASLRPAYCAMDLKFGTQLWGLDADPKKKKRMELKARNTTSSSTGLCLIAYRCTSPATGRTIVNVSREYTKQIVTTDALKTHLKTFFALASHRTLEVLTKKIRRLRDWFVSQTFIHFHSSSLLIIYDSRSDEELISSPGADVAEVKLIDFAHASFFHSTPDYSSLLGLNNLIKYMEEFMAVFYPSDDDVAWQ
eukprot:Blabericola_migrator_1__6081@NODE_306_length_10090_cov_155_786691_g250_i0_p2_GENE_NODE_306_length_10090_cov_155_786691_g250_i0NODE_306_length_10090_cov_155_786691_g250_i0_p2_ORF_typecomplete_len669_score74_65IPK/PF03770_16/7_3e35_NODE_306_length_10090_cov_155_786691_g250_i065418547